MSQSAIEKLISRDDQARISQAVAAAEETTSGEIVPVVVGRSSHVGHVPLQLSLLLMTIVFVVLDLHQLLAEHFAWRSEWWASLAYPFSVVLVCAVVWMLALALSRLPSVQRWLIPKSDQRSQVDQRALVEFELSNIRKTKSKTGILIMLSVMERRAVVLADQAISERLPPETWTALVEGLLRGVREGQTSQALIKAVQSCGELLAQHFPPEVNDQNELPNQLIIKE